MSTNRDFNIPTMGMHNTGGSRPERLMKGLISFPSCDQPANQKIAAIKDCSLCGLLVLFGGVVGCFRKCSETFLESSSRKGNMRRKNSHARMMQLEKTGSGK